MKTPIQKKYISPAMLDAAKAALRPMRDCIPKQLVEDLAATMHSATLNSLLRENLVAIKAEAAYQRKLWSKATATTKRQRGYRLPKLPAGYESLVPTEDTRLDNVDQTEENYDSAIHALDVACKLYLALAQPPCEGTPVTIMDGLEDYFLIHPAMGASLATLKQDYKRAVAAAERLDPDNYQQDLVFAELVMKGHACQGPLEVHNWSSLA